MPEKARAFVDTNVFVYALDDAEPDKRDRARSLLAEEHEAAVVSTQVLGELYVTATRKLEKPLRKAEAREAISWLSELPVVAVDAGLVDRAAEISDLSQLSYWDGLIIAAAESSGCERLLSEDLSDGQVIAGVRIENPFA
ncbi:MAG: PIN domain-containing protein [Solirubrobacterales bacterium]